MLFKSAMCLASFAMTLLLLFTSIASANCLLNQKVMTYIDISTQHVIVKNRVTVKNKNAVPIDSYLLIVDPQWMHNLSYIEALDADHHSLHVNRVYTDDSWLKYEIMFHNPLPTGDIETIEIYSVIINYLQSYPKRVKQNEKHFVLFSFNVYYYSAYFTQSQTTYLYLGTTAVTSVDGVPFKLSDDKNYGLKYGPFSNMEQTSENISIIHYENDSPFLTVEKLDRFVKISHWGFISVWEHIILVHTGPKFTGHYERPTSKNVPKDTRIESFTTTLPGDSFDIYLKDEIGLISSFNVEYSDPNKVQVNISPRNVMYGGWKTEYEIYYSLPISNYITQYNFSFILSIPVVDRIFRNMVIKEAEITIILPEGAFFEDINPYFDLQNNTDNQYCYFMDIFCREIVSFKRSNLVELHGNNVALTYTHSQLFLLTKPLVFALSIYVFFIVFIIFYKPSIGSEPKKTISQASVINKEPVKHKIKPTKGKSKKC